jgi:DnaJ-class molecular chaperone
MRSVWWFRVDSYQDGMIMGKDTVRACQNCHGSGTVMVEVKPGKWQRQTCYACGGTGKIIMPNI